MIADKQCCWIRSLPRQTVCWRNDGCPILFYKMDTVGYIHHFSHSCHITASVDRISGPFFRFSGFWGLTIKNFIRFPFDLIYRFSVTVFIPHHHAPLSTIFLIVCLFPFGNCRTPPTSPFDLMQHPIALLPQLSALYLLLLHSSSCALPFVFRESARSKVSYISMPWISEQV